VFKRRVTVPEAVVRALLIKENGEGDAADVLMDELWAVLHGMAALYLDRLPHSILDPHKTV